MKRRAHVPLLSATLAVLLLATACGSGGPPAAATPAAGRPTAAEEASPPTEATATATSPVGAATATSGPTGAAGAPTVATHRYTTTTFPVPAGSRPHDVAPAPDGTVWYTGQGSGDLGRLDPRTGNVQRVPLGGGSAPHGVIVGPDGAAWVTDSGLNAIVRVTTAGEVKAYPLPADRARANLNTAAFDGRGRLWFTGQAGVYGVLDPASGEMQVFDAPRGTGPYGIAATPNGEVYYVSLAGSYLGKVDLDRHTVTVLDPPTLRQGARRVWSDSAGRLWISEWFAGRLGRYEPDGERWQEWPLPGQGAQPYAVYVDETDTVWLSDFRANAFVWFDPHTEEFGSIPLPHPNAAIRQILGRPGEVWGPMSGADALIVIRPAQ